MDDLFKKGIWIKQQQGSLTVGSLDESDETVTVIPDTLCQKIFEFENDMIDALYGGDAITFNPECVDIDRLLKNIEKKYSGQNLRVSFSNNPSVDFKQSYDKIYFLLESLIQSSLKTTNDQTDPTIIYINASILENHLCIIYRDSNAICQPATIKDAILSVKNDLKGEISFKATGSKKSYFDITIPSL